MSCYKQKLPITIQIISQPIWRLWKLIIDLYGKDTDGDLVVDFVDADDDGDGTATSDEVGVEVYISRHKS